MEDQPKFIVKGQEKTEVTEWSLKKDGEGNIVLRAANRVWDAKVFVIRPDGSGYLPQMSRSVARSLGVALNGYNVLLLSRG